jgi:hypothetical protein
MGLETRSARTELKNLKRKKRKRERNKEKESEKICLFVAHGEKERAGVTEWNKGEGRKKELRGQSNIFTLQMCDYYTKQFGMLTLKQISNLLSTFNPVTSKMFDSYKSNDLLFN